MYAKYLKRALDFLLSLTALLVLSPVLINILKGVERYNRNNQEKDCFSSVVAV